MQAQAAYDELIRRSREETLLASCTDLLAWDEETYLPPAGVGHRAEQLALLAVLSHDRAADPRVGELLAAVEGSNLLADPDSAAAANIREIRRTYNRSRSLPRAFVEEITRVASFAQQEWAAARREADFARFAPWLEHMIRLKRREADCLGYEKHPYDALLEDYEPGTRTDDLQRLFAALRADLVPLANKLREPPRRPNLAILRREFPVGEQRAFAVLAATKLGYDFQAGRIDTATHPFFAAIGPGDCRITARFDAHNFNDGFFGALHEVGHALYEQGLNSEHYGTPLGQAASLAVHESQSRLWENTVGRSPAFWRCLFRHAELHFPDALKDVSQDDFVFAVNNVGATLIRVTADEVTYNLHILIRFELERALIAADLAVADLPAAWNDAYRHYLGISPANDAEGCLQDGHWAAGLVGYFPTYTLGNLYAAQLFAKACEELGDLSTAFARDDFGVLLGWLREKVYRQGGRYTATRLIENVTGSPPDHRPLLTALRRKYEELYGV